MCGVLCGTGHAPILKTLEFLAGSAYMMKSFLPLAFLLLVLPVPAGGAEFDIDTGRTILRRLQFCSDCGSALLVTGVHPGTMVRCPDCGREQPRLDNQYLLTQVYQICRLCMSPLEAGAHHPGDIVECPSCHTRQALTRDAFPSGEVTRGLGYVPGFPPGSGKKSLLYSLNAPDAPVTPIPLEDSQSDLPLPGEDVAMRMIPRPPEAIYPESAPPPPEPPLPELSPTVETTTPPASTPHEATAGLAAVDVPAVTVDLFGGKRGSSVSYGRAYTPSGRVLARVDGEAIYEAEVDRVVEPVMRQIRGRVGPDDSQGLATREKALRREVLDRLVDRQLAVREAAAIGHRPDPAAVRAREQELAHLLADTGIDIRREAERDVTMSDMRRRFAEKPGAASPEAIREFYRANRDQMMRPRLLALDQLIVYQYRAGHPDPRDYETIAREVSESLERGEGFDALRERHDEFIPAAGIPRAKPALQPAGAYASSILAAAGDLRKGAVFGPLFLEGMALFGKVVEERPEGPAPFEEVEKDIRHRLENEAAEKSLDAWLKRLHQKARVEICPEGDR